MHRFRDLNSAPAFTQRFRAPGARPVDAAGQSGVPVEFRGVSRTYGSGAREVHALIDLNLTVQSGELLSLLGPSGSGKTTALQVIAGLQEPSAGTIYLGGKEVTALPPHKRDMGVVFQGYALFPHLTVAQNVAFPLRLRRLDRDEISRQVAEALELVQLGNLGDRRPAQLSGGQQQRVAIARALVFRPRVLLMDEPLGALDRKLRDQLQLEVRDLQKRVGITCIYVTHDQEEAMLMSDRIAIMKDGRLQQLGTAEDVYYRPANEFVGGFVGRMNFWPGTVATSNGDGSVIELTPDIRVRSAEGAKPGTAVRVGARPESLKISAHPPADTASSFEIEIHAARFTGSVTLVQGTCGPGIDVLVEVDRGTAEVPSTGQAWVIFDPKATHVFAIDKDGKQTPAVSGARGDL